MDISILRKFIEEDDLGLLDISPQTHHNTPEERAVEGFMEINDFVTQYGRTPDTNSPDGTERTLAFRLNGYLDDISNYLYLREYDPHHLLNNTDIPREPQSIEEIFASDELGLLDTDRDIFNLKHISKTIHQPDYIGQYRPCVDFDQFSQLFIDCQKDLRNKNRALSPFTSEKTITEGKFFVCCGILHYIAEVGEPQLLNGRKQKRLRCILENGKEADILVQSLAKNLYHDGKIVSPNLNEAIAKLSGVTPDDNSTGHIYILQSASRDERVRSIKDLYKIGCCTTSVKERVRNAETEFTYLMARVRIKESYEVYNLDVQSFESLLHRFFTNARVSIDVNDIHGTRHTVQEWFQIPLAAIKQAIILILDGEIVNYRYDRDAASIVPLKND